MLTLKNLHKTLFSHFTRAAFASATPTTPPGSVVGSRERVNVFAKNEVGILSRILSVFHYNKVTLTSASTKLLDVKPDGSQEAYFAIDFEGSRGDIAAQKALQELNLFTRAYVEPEVPEVPWFPVRHSDLDSIGKLMDMSTHSENKDHPGFADQEYRDRRAELTKIGLEYKMGDPIPRIPYSKNENQTWNTIWNRLRPLQKQTMCTPFNDNFTKLEKAGVYTPEKIPQLEDVNQFLMNMTGFRIKPVSGLLTQREFLNALGMRVFCSTQYIRHHSKPEYTPEPDIIHELLGHVPMFCDPDFADLSHQIGLLSMGNNEQNITLLSTLYWYTVEFGGVKEGKEKKGYGAGIASSIGEIEHFASSKAKFRPLNPFKELPTNYVIQDIQQHYYVANSFKEAGDTLIKFGEYLPRPFKAYYNRITNNVEVDRKIKLVAVDEKPLEFLQGP